MNTPHPRPLPTRPLLLANLRAPRPLFRGCPILVVPLALAGCFSLLSTLDCQGQWQINSESSWATTSFEQTNSWGTGVGTASSAGGGDFTAAVNSQGLSVGGGGSATTTVVWGGGPCSAGTSITALDEGYASATWTWTGVPGGAPPETVTFLNSQSGQVTCSLGYLQWELTFLNGTLPAVVNFGASAEAFTFAAPSYTLSSASGSPSQSAAKGVPEGRVAKGNSRKAPKGVLSPMKGPGGGGSGGGGTSWSTQVQATIGATNAAAFSPVGNGQPWTSTNITPATVWSGGNYTMWDGGYIGGTYSIYQTGSYVIPAGAASITGTAYSYCESNTYLQADSDGLFMEPFPTSSSTSIVDLNLSFSP